EISVDEDFPAWCRMTGNELVSFVRQGTRRSCLVCKGALVERVASGAPARRVRVAPVGRTPVAVCIPTTLPPPAPALAVASLSVMGIGSWPRPRWMLRALHEHLEGRLGDDEFEATARDAVRLAVDAQVRAGVDVVTDGEQRRDNYASFVGGRLDNCQLIPLTDLLPLVDDPKNSATSWRPWTCPPPRCGIRRSSARWGAVVRWPATSTRSFMCGALSQKGDSATELRFARALIDRVVAGLPRERLALHVCRGNWTRDERVALAGDYRPLLPLLAEVKVGTLLLELCT